MTIVFYDKDGISISDTASIHEKHNDNEYRSSHYEHMVCAKAELNEKTNKYYVKKCTVGGNAGQLANPYGPMSNPTDLARVDTRSGRRYYEYSEVNQEVFNDYVQFLKTRNPAYFNQASRAILTKGK